MPAPKGTNVIRGDDVRRFWSKTRVDGSCIVWAGARYPDGRGKFMTGPRGGQTTHIAPRWFWERLHGAIPAGLVVLHECDNPSCVAPQHLSIGSQRVNQEQMLRRDRLGARTKLRNEDVVAILAELESGRSARDVARARGLPVQLVQRIKRGETWKHLR